MRAWVVSGGMFSIALPLQAGEVGLFKAFQRFRFLPTTESRTRSDHFVP